MLGKHIRVEGCDFVVEVIGDLYTIRLDKMTYERMFDKENITVGDDTTFEKAVQFVEQCRDVLERLCAPL